MSLGIVRAADRVAIWHDAAQDDDLGEVDQESLSNALGPFSSPSTSEPPAGAPAVPVSKSKKFLNPANHLKKTLETTADPAGGWHPESTDAVQAHFDQFPNWANSYAKPQYADMLKAHLGDENYGKLMHHAPTPITDALTKYKQSPAPNSAKFNNAANALKKILEDPHTETAHVQDWLSKGHGAAFAKTYLKPNYDDAVKSHLGDKNYNELKQHLQQMIKTDQPAPMSPAEKVKQNAQEAFGPAGFKVKTEDEFFNDHAPQSSQPTSKYYEQLKNIGEGSEGHKIINLPAFKDWLHKNYPNIDSDQAKPSPSGLVKQFKKEKGQAVQDAVYGQPAPQPKTNYDELNIPKTLKLPGDTTEHVQNWLSGKNGQVWAKDYLFGPKWENIKHYPWAQEFVQHLTPEQQAKIGGGQASDDDLGEFDEEGEDWPDEAYEPQSLGEKMQAINPAINAEVFDKQSPEGQQDILQNIWAKDEVYGPAFQKLHDEHFGQGSDEDEAAAIRQQMGPQGLSTDLIKKYFPNVGDSSAREWLNQKDPQAYIQQHIDHLSDPDYQLHSPETAAKWQKIYDEAYGKSEELPGISNEPEQEWEQQLLPQQPQVSDKTQHPTLLQGIKKIFPNADIDPDATDAQMKAQIEGWLTHLDHPDLAGHVQQLQALHDKFFGGQQQAPAGGQPSPEDAAFQAWYAQTVNMTPEQAKQEFAKMSPAGIKAWSPGGAQYEKYGPGTPVEQQQPQIPQAHVDHAKILDAYGEPSEDFMQWFAKDNGYKWGENPAADKDLLEMLHDPDNKWTKQKVQGYLKAQGEQGAIGGGDALKQALIDSGIFGSGGDSKNIQEWMDKDPDDQKADLTQLANGYSAITGKPLTDAGLIAKWKQVYDTVYGGEQGPVFGFGSGNQNHLDFINAIKNAFGLETAQGWAGKTPEEQASYLNTVALGGGQPGANAKILQQEFADYLGGGGQQSKPPGLQSFIDHHSGPGQTLKPDDPIWLEQWNEMSPGEQQKFIDQEPGGQGGGFSGWNPSQFHQDLANISEPENGWNPHNWFGDPHDADPDDIKLDMQDQLGAIAPGKNFEHPEHYQKLKQVFDKHFGGGAQQQVDPNAYPGASFAGITQDFIANLPTGFYEQHYKNSPPAGVGPKLDPGVAAFLESKGYGPGELEDLPYNSADKPSQVGLMHDWQALSQSAQDQFAAQEQEGQGAPQQPTKTLGESLQGKGLPGGGTFVGGIWDKWPREKQQQKLQENINEAKGAGETAYANELQQIYNQYFGGSAGQQPSSPGQINVNELWKDIVPGDPAYWNGPHGLSDLANKQANGELQAYIKDLANNQSDDLPPEESAHYQKVYDKYYGGGQQQQQAAPQVTTPEHLDQFASLFGAAPEQQADFVEAVPKNADTAGQTVDEYLQKKYPSKYKKWLEMQSGQQQGGLGEAPAQSPAYDPDAAFEDWKKIYSKSSSESHFATPEEAQKWMAQKLALWPVGSEKHDQIKAMQEKWFGGSQQSQWTPGGPVPSKEQLLAWGVSPATADSITEKPEDFWNSYNHVSDMKDKLGDKWEEGGNYPPDHPWNKIVKGVQGGGQQAPGTPHPFNKDSFFDDYAEAYGAPPGSGKQMAFHTMHGDESPQEIAQALKEKIKNFKGTAKGDKLQALYDKHFGQGAAAPAPKAPFDWDTFGPEYKALVPSSGWADETHSEEEAESKLKAKVDAANSQYPDSDKTKALNDLYQKHFGDGPAPKATSLTDDQVDELHAQGLLDNAEAVYFKGNTPEWWDQKLKQWAANPPSNPNSAWGKVLKKLNEGPAPKGGLDAFFEEVNKHQEPPEEPSKPFKTEKAKAADVKNWLANKPESPEDWKNFSTWWGNTKLTPKQEAGLYNTWFGKNATPEHANEWFQSVFEHNSTPTNADLGMTGTPGWAHNSWAFGKNAEAQWPVFQAWATKHPGIPKNTSVKQKVGIWNSLSDQDKADIKEEYLPDAAVDTKAVVKGLKDAYPESNFSKWQNLTQPQLKKSLEALANSGSAPATALLNQHFGTDLPMPQEAPEEGAEPEAPKQTQLPPAESLPPWVQAQLQDKNPNQAHKLTTEFVNLAHWANSIGEGDTVLGDEKPADLGKIWNKLPSHLKAQVGAMTNPPWSDLAGFEQWKAAQPTVMDAVKQAIPGWDSPKYLWSAEGPGYDREKQHELGKLIATADPATKQKLLEIQHQYFGHGKTTLAESLKDIIPEQDWDKFLQSKPKNSAANFIKKQLKEEKDPLKWAQLANTWYKHIGHSENAGDVAPTGVKALNDLFKYKSPGQALTASELSRLKKWKETNPNNETDYIGWQGDDIDPQAQQVADGEAGKSYLPYIGWTPPSGTAPSAASFKVAPENYIQQGGQGKTYTAEPEAQATGQHYKTLSDVLDKNPWGYSKKDKETAASEGFRNWFAKAPKGYQQAYDDHPGVALDDFAEFMKGGKPYGDFAAGSSGPTKYIDVSPFAAVPKRHQKDVSGKPLPGYLTHNPPRQHNDFVKFPRKNDEQETLPLGPGEKFAPGYSAMPIYRVMKLDLNQDPANNVPSHVPPEKKHLFIQQQKARLRRIDEIINGGGTLDRSKGMADFENFAQKSGLDDKAKDELALQLFRPEQGDLFTDSDKWGSLKDFADKHNISINDISDLAKKMDVMPPPGAKPNYDHPELANLILDYFENYGDGGVGYHWTRDIDKAYHGVPAAGSGAEVDVSPSHMGRHTKIPVVLHGLWSGQGEHSTGQGGAYDVKDQSELEHNLENNAPVNIRRMRIRSPDSDWHDLIDHGPISEWGEGRNETACPPGYRWQGGSGGHCVKVYDMIPALDKPSLANNLDRLLPGEKHDPQHWDTLKPGRHADEIFSKLIGEHPEKKKEILKEWERFFVGRPDLPTKPHVRRASLQRLPSPVVLTAATLDERNPMHLFDLARSWGIPSPERYGIPAKLQELKGLARDLAGVGFATKSIIKQHGFGMPGYREVPPPGTTAAIEAAIIRVAGDFDHVPADHPALDPHWLKYYGDDAQNAHYDWLRQVHPDELNSWGAEGTDPGDDAQASFEDYLDANGIEHTDEPEDDEDDYDDTWTGDDEDHEYSDHDFDIPPEPSGDRPEGWVKPPPLLKNDPRARQYFPPHGLNPESTSVARPDMGWDIKDHEQDPLPMSSDKSHLQTWDEWPHDREPVSMYRGLPLNLSHKELGPLRRALWGSEFEPDDDASPFASKAQPHPLGFDNPALGEHILNHVQNNPKDYEGVGGYGLGPHWSANTSTAKEYSKAHKNGTGNSMQLPVVMRAQWKGLGEDPYRIHTMGDWPGENEVTMLPGAKMNVDSVKIQHPHTGQWHEVLGEPTEKHASLIEAEIRLLEGVPGRYNTASEVRKPRGILTQSEMRQ